MKRPSDRRRLTSFPCPFAFAVFAIRHRCQRSAELFFVNEDVNEGVTFVSLSSLSILESISGASSPGPMNLAMISFALSGTVLLM